MPLSLAHTTYHFSLFFFNDTATTEIYTLSLHDALPICQPWASRNTPRNGPRPSRTSARKKLSPGSQRRAWWRSEEHTSELQSHLNLVCRLLLEKKKKKDTLNSEQKHTLPRPICPRHTAH